MTGHAIITIALSIILAMSAGFVLGVVAVRVDDEQRNRRRDPDEVWRIEHWKRPQ